MMPLTQKVAPTPQGRARAVHVHLITSAMLRSQDEFVHYLGWCTSMLNKHGSTEQPAPVAVRVFVRAVHCASSASQWAAFRPVLQSSCSEEIWNSIVETYRIDEPTGDNKLAPDAEAAPAPTPTPAPAPATATTPSAAIAAAMQPSSVQQVPDPPMGRYYIVFYFVFKHRSHFCLH